MGFLQHHNSDGLDTFYAIYMNFDMICIRHINKFYVTNTETSERRADNVGGIGCLQIP